MGYRAPRVALIDHVALIAFDAAIAAIQARPEARLIAIDGLPVSGKAQAPATQAPALRWARAAARRTSAPYTRFSRSLDSGWRNRAIQGYRRSNSGRRRG